MAKAIPQEILEKLHQAEQQMVPPELREKGWIYRDIPGRCSPKAWDDLIAIAGEGNYQIVVCSSGSGSGGPWKRGQFFFSPQAIQNFKDYAAAKRNPKGDSNE